MHLFPRWNDSWLAVILALNLLHLFSFFRTVCVIDLAKLLFLEFNQICIHPATVVSNAWFFFEKVFLQDTSPADHSLQQHKTVLQIAYHFFFWVFEDLHPYNSYYTILKALGELVLIIKLSSRSSKSGETTELLLKISSTWLRSFNFNNCWIVI